MKPMMTLLTSVAMLPALAACGGGNRANEVTADEINHLATPQENIVVEDANVAAPVAPEATTPAAPAQANATETSRPARPSASPPARPTSRHKASPPQPADPHAGHDMSSMGNMANMAH